MWGILHCNIIGLNFVVPDPPTLSYIASPSVPPTSCISCVHVEPTVGGVGAPSQRGAAIEVITVPVERIIVMQDKYQGNNHGCYPWYNEGAEFGRLKSHCV